MNVIMNVIMNVMNVMIERYGGEGGAPVPLHRMAVAQLRLFERSRRIPAPRKNVAAQQQKLRIRTHARPLQVRSFSQSLVIIERYRDT